MFFGVIRKKVNCCVCSGWFPVYVYFKFSVSACYTEMHGQQNIKSVLLMLHVFRSQNKVHGIRVPVILGNALQKEKTCKKFRVDEIK